jgi:hypothetical protein
MKSDWSAVSTLQTWSHSQISWKLQCHAVPALGKRAFSTHRPGVGLWVDARAFLGKQIPTPSLRRGPCKPRPKQITVQNS